MMAAIGGQELPVAPLVLDDPDSLGALAAAVMRLHGTLLTTGRVYTTGASGSRAELERGTRRVRALWRVLHNLWTVAGQSLRGHL